MKKVEEILKSLKDELSSLLGIMLVSERTNSQRCIAKDLDTTKTIVDHKENLSQEELNEIGSEIKKLTEDIKGMTNLLLTNERINSQRCIAKDLDTSKTIIDYNDTKDNSNFTHQDVEHLITEAKILVDTILVSERVNSQRCVAKDIDTTKTIIDHKDEKEEFSNQDIKSLIGELKGIVSEMLISERINSQRCVAKDLDTTKTIIDHKE